MMEIVACVCLMVIPTYRYNGFRPWVERCLSLKDNTLRITKTPKYNPNYFMDDYQRKGDNYNIPNTKSVHYKSWELINKIIGNKVNITNYNKTDKLDYLNKDVQSVGNSSIDIMKRGDSKVKITFDKNF